MVMPLIARICITMETYIVSKENNWCKVLKGVQLRFCIVYKLSWGPFQLSASNYVNVKVIHTLCAILTIIDHQAESIRSHAFILGYLLSSIDQVSQNVLLILAGIAQAIKTVFVLGDDKEMDRTLRVNVPKRQAKIIFENNICRDLFGHNLVEEGGRSGVDCWVT